MHRILRSVVEILFLIAGIAAIGGGIIWYVAINGGGSGEGARDFAIVASALLMSFGGLLAWDTYRPAHVPDFLRALCGDSYDAQGVHIMTAPLVTTQGPVLQVFYQNQSANPVETKLSLTPHKGIPMDTGLCPQVTLSLAIPGGGFGVTLVPWAVNPSLHGQPQQIFLRASNKKPHGPGKKLLFRRAESMARLVDGDGAASMPTLANLSGPTAVVHQWPDGCDQPISTTSKIEDLIVWQPATQPTWEIREQQLGRGLEAYAQLIEERSPDELFDPQAYNFGCTVCGSRDSEHVTYVLSIGVGAYWFSLTETKPVCREHLVRLILPTYLGTLITGWLGVSILFWPFSTFGNARAMAPAIGRAWWVLATAPAVMVLAGIGAIVFLQG